MASKLCLLLLLLLGFCIMGSTHMLSFLMPSWINNRQKFNDWFCGQAHPCLKGDDPRCEEMIAFGIKHCTSVLKPKYSWTRVWNIIKRKLYTPPQELATCNVLQAHFLGNDVEQCKAFLEMERVAKQQKYLDGEANMTNIAIAVFLFVILAFTFMRLMFEYRKKKINEKKAYDQEMEKEDEEDFPDLINFDEGDGEQFLGDLDETFGVHKAGFSLDDGKNEMPQGKEELISTFAKVEDKEALGVSIKNPASVKFYVSDASPIPKRQKPVTFTKPARELAPVSQFEKVSSLGFSYSKQKRTPDAARVSYPRSTQRFTQRSTPLTPPTPRTPYTSHTSTTNVEGGAKPKSKKERTPRPEWQLTAIKAAEKFGTPGSFHSKIPIPKKQ